MGEPRVLVGRCSCREHMHWIWVLPSAILAWWWGANFPGWPSHWQMTFPVLGLTITRSALAAFQMCNCVTWAAFKSKKVYQKTHNQPICAYYPTQCPFLRRAAYSVFCCILLRQKKNEWLHMMSPASGNTLRIVINIIQNMIKADVRHEVGDSFAVNSRHQVIWGHSNFFEALCDRCRPPHSCWSNRHIANRLVQQVLLLGSRLCILGTGDFQHTDGDSACAKDAEPRFWHQIPFHGIVRLCKHFSLSSGILKFCLLRVLTSLNL